MNNRQGKRKKIVRIISRLNIGGPAIHAILLSSEFNKNGDNDVLVTGRPSSFEGDMSNFALSKNIQPVVIPELGREISLVRDIKALLKLYRLLKKQKPDIVHTHTAKAGTLGRLAAIFAGVPVKIHTFHGHIFDGYFNRLKAKFFLVIERFLALFSDRVIAVSDQIKSDITKKLRVTNEKKCVTIPLGLELEKFAEPHAEESGFRKKFNIDDDTVFVGLVGRLVPIKNHKMLLSAAEKIKNMHQDVKIAFAIIGDGETRDSLFDFVKSHRLGDIVFFAGWQEDLPPVYAGLDIVALTSLNEGTPVSIIEAMASGKPVIATDVGGVKDLITDGKTGLLVASSDVDDFADKLLALARDKEKQKILGENAKRSVIEKYSKRRLVNDVNALYEEVLASKYKA